MKLLTLLLLSSLSLTAKAELTFSESIKGKEKPKSEVTDFQDEVKDDVKEEVKAEESITASSSIYSLFLSPSENAQSYSLKVTKEGKVYLNSRYFAQSSVKIEHKIKLEDGQGIYKIEYIEYASSDASNAIYIKNYTLTYKSTDVIKNAKSSKWVQTNDPRIMSLSNSIVAGIEGEYEKVLAINDWITNNIVYNQTSTMFSQKIDAITTLKMKMGICTGYSNLFAALARASGLETKVMTGKAKNMDGKTYYHQWNEVKIDGTWYFIDTTWNAGLKKRVFFTKASEYPKSHKRPSEVRSY